MKLVYLPPTVRLILLMLLAVFSPASAQLTTFHTLPGELGEPRIAGDELDSISDIPILKITKRSFNPDDPTQITPDPSFCDSVFLENVGTAMLTIDSMGWADGTRGYGIDRSVTTPFLLAPNERRAVGVCLDSRGHGVQRDTLLVWSDARTSLLVGMMMDISRSMEERMECDTSSSRLRQAIVQAKKLISRRLLFEPFFDIHDRLMIQSFTNMRSSSYPFPLVTEIHYPFPQADFDSAAAERAMAAVDSLVTMGGTPLGEAVIEMVDSLAASRARNRIIILITDGQATDVLDFPVTTLIGKARDHGVRIFTIGIADTAEGKRYLDSLARGTGGLGRTVTDCETFRTSFTTVADSMRRGSVIAEPFAMRVDADLGADDAPGTVREGAITGVTPQPASGTVTISFRAAAGALYLDIHDARGALVKRVMEGGRHDAGEREVTIDAGGLASGLYIIRLHQGGRTLTHTFVVMK